tara:strand:+ start:7961 stop:8644 length:684 start_codon:yes stop_codon:yes gene_type:complete
MLTSTDNSNKLILHFESPKDMQFVRGFYQIQKKTGFLKKREIGTEPEFFFTHTKGSAISEHENARKNNLKISTLVDMDHDVKNNQFRGLAGVRSTRYACTLLTMQFLKNETELDEEYLVDILKRIGKNLNDDQCMKIKDRAIKTTWERLNRGNRFARENLEDKNVYTPLNDHSLSESIVVELFGKDNLLKTEINEIEDQMRRYALKDNNNRLAGLLNQMLVDVGAIS